MSGPDSLGYGLTVPGDDAGHAPAPLSTGAIFAIAIAVAVALVLAALLIYCCCFRKRTRRAATATPPLAGIRVGVFSAGPELPGAGSDGAATGRSSAAAAGGRDAPGPSSGAGCRLCRALDGGEVGVALECGHAFHRRCIRRWMQHNRTCPVCNATNIALLGGSSRDAIGGAFRAPRLSVDDAASTDELVEIRRSSSSRF